MTADNAQSLLGAAYRDLEFSAGTLRTAGETPGDSDRAEWTRLGGWLALAKKVGAERVFFVDDNPVVVFIDASKSQREWQSAFNRTWCMARPPLLFLAQPGELGVYDLTRPPAREADTEAERHERLLGVAHTAAEVHGRLQEYHRSRVEGGDAFAGQAPASQSRADRALVEDLRQVRKALLGTGMPVPYAHALIGRSIFIRYLEDRRILVEQYYRRVAGEKRRWHETLDGAPANKAGRDDRRPFYTSVLRDRGFTAALFRALASDFNGDLFPIDRNELKELTPERLQLVRRLLTGEMEGEHLFFFAYDFEIVPIDLISSIYEEFLKVEKGKDGTHGSFYTPAALVDFVLARTLDESTLASRPRIVDPACGSGIFLVEAFQRLARHRMGELGRRLRPVELRKILREQIAGIDVNAEAVRVAAFSLYLALLNHLDPPDILGQTLPTLTYRPARGAGPDEHFDILVVANAFAVAEAVADSAVLRRFNMDCADVVIGNPPWGQPTDGEPGATAAAEVAMRWCSENGKQVGDKELSQAFIHRAIQMLREGGKAGLLVSTGVLLKRAGKSRDFRREWLAGSTLIEVVNFAAVRHVFFTGRGRTMGAIAPFASVVFSKAIYPRGHRFRYYSAKATAFVARLQAVLLALPDLHVVPQEDVLRDEDLWKIFWWGGHRDAALIKSLRAERTLQDFVDPDGDAGERFGSGFKKSRKNQQPAIGLSAYKELPSEALVRYGPTPTDAFIDPPANVERERDNAIYEGCRLLVKRGIMERDGAMGRIIARLATEPFCFKHSVYAIRLPDVALPQAAVLLGTLWSSLTRYFAWMASGSWGMWHHEILKETVARLPVRTEMDNQLRERIEGVVARLRQMPVHDGTLFGTDRNSLSAQEVLGLERALDDAIFDLFCLNDAERDLVRDTCEVGLELFYRGEESDALRPVSWPQLMPKFGYASDLEGGSKPGILGAYLRAFLDIWNRELPPDGCFSWQVVPSGDRGMVGVIFRTEDVDERSTPVDATSWGDVLKKYAAATPQPFGSRSIYIDAMTRIVTEHEVVIIKKNQRRLWTSTAGREDADATLLQAIDRQQLLRAVRSG